MDTRGSTSARIRAHITGSSIQGGMLTLRSFASPTTTQRSAPPATRPRTRTSRPRSGCHGYTTMRRSVLRASCRVVDVRHRRAPDGSRPAGRSKYWRRWRSVEVQPAPERRQIRRLPPPHHRLRPKGSTPRRTPFASSSNWTTLSRPRLVTALGPTRTKSTCGRRRSRRSVNPARTRGGRCLAERVSVGWRSHTPTPRLKTRSQRISGRSCRTPSFGIKHSEMTTAPTPASTISFALGIQRHIFEKQRLQKNS